MYFINIVLGITQLLIIGYILICEVHRKSPIVFLWATLLVMFGIPHLLSGFIHDVNYSYGILSQASIFVIGFCIIYLISRRKKKCVFYYRDEKSGEIGFNTEMPGTLLELICFTIFLVSITVYLIDVIRSQGGLLNTSWATGREITDNYVDISGLTSRLLFTFSGLSVYYFLTKRKKTGIFVILLFAILVLVTRNRVQGLPVFIFIVVLFLMKIEKIEVKHIIIAAALGVTFIYIIYAIRAFRYMGTLSNAISNFSWDYINTTVKDFLSDGNGELGLRQYFYYFIEQDNNFEGFNRGYTYIRMLLVYIPAGFTFGLKPEGFDLYMGQAVGMAAGGSMHPTLFGDCFGNLYWFGILLGGLWALIANVIDLMINNQRDDYFKILLYCLAAYSFVIIGRGSVYNGFGFFAWGALFLFIIKVIFGKYKKVRIRFRGGIK